MNLLNLFKKKQKESVNTDTELKSLAEILVAVQNLQLEYCKTYHITISSQCDDFELSYISISIHTFIDTQINTSKYYSFGAASMLINNKELNMMKKYLKEHMNTILVGE